MRIARDGDGTRDEVTETRWEERRRVGWWRGEGKVDDGDGRAGDRRWSERGRKK